MYIHLYEAKGYMRELESTILHVDDINVFSWVMKT